MMIRNTFPLIQKMVDVPPRSWLRWQLSLVWWGWWWWASLELRHW